MNTAPTEPSLDLAFARRWVDEFVASFTQQATKLADLDRQAGDGDFGANLTSALRRAQGFIEADNPETFADVLFAVSKGFLNTGGTSGPLFGMWFRELAKATTDDPVDLAALTEGVSDGLATIQRLGGAEIGDKTMVDAIAPAAEALSTTSTRDLGISDVLAAAADAAQTGAQSTRDLLASRGRASYVGEVARGVLDPGAVTVALLFAAAVSAAGETSPDTNWIAVS